MTKFLISTFQKLNYIKQQLIYKWKLTLFAVILLLFLLFMYNLSSVTLTYQFNCEKLEANYINCKINKNKLYRLIPLSEKKFRIKNVTIEKDTIYKLYLNSEQEKFLYDYDSSLEKINNRKNILEGTIKNANIDNSLNKNIYPNFTEFNQYNYSNFILSSILYSLNKTLLLLNNIILFTIVFLVNLPIILIVSFIPILLIIGLIFHIFNSLSNVLKRMKKNNKIG